jgi:hypothetical protein
MEKIDWKIIKDAIENNWFESDPKVTDAEIDEMAIGIAGEVDNLINSKKVNNTSLWQKCYRHGKTYYFLRMTHENKDMIFNEITIRSVPDGDNNNPVIKLETPLGIKVCKIGDYIVKDIRENTYPLFYVYDPEQFTELYEFIIY